VTRLRLVADRDHPAFVRTKSGYEITLKDPLTR